jgi:acetate---CoA ligase (ADP-forming)
VAIITGSGGSAVWMADILSAHGLELPVLEDDIQRRLMAMLPSYASAQNPVDATAQAIGEVGYAPMLELVLQSERIDTVLLISSLANESRAKKMAEELASITAIAKKPILMCTYTTASAAAIGTLAEIGIPCYTSMPSCARAIRALVDYGAFQERLAKRAPLAPTDPARREAVARLLDEAGPVLTEIGSKALLAEYGVKLPPEALAKSEDEAVAAAVRIGRPVALKVQSPHILHKTEAGALALGVEGEAGVREAYRAILARVLEPDPQVRIEGVLVQAMAPRGVEMILGITRDPDFGPMLMVGLGGIHVEVLKDVAFAPVPLGEDEALTLLDELKGAALLGGVRGEKPADKTALARLMAAVSRFAADHAGAVAEIDLNPVIVHPQGEGLSVVDALIVKT